MNCPRCSSEPIVKNGLTHRGKQNFKCRGQIGCSKTQISTSYRRNQSLDR
ncbi:IS1/IS1595 family N-terminal zinc-binding domain-containing protein [Kamptonema formosum]